MYNFIDPRVPEEALMSASFFRTLPDGFNPHSWVTPFREHPHRVFRLEHDGKLVCMADACEWDFLGDSHPTAPRLGKVLKVWYMETHLEHRREGHASRMFDGLMRAFPGMPVIGFSSNDEAWNEFELTSLYPANKPNTDQLLVYLPSTPGLIAQQE